jgi:hypothetical protein
MFNSVFLKAMEKQKNDLQTFKSLGLLNHNKDLNSSEL